MLIKQNKRCLICDVEFSVDVRSKNCCVDHDHKTGKVRGLLCRGCNSGIGMFKENEYVLLKAIQYLKENKNAN